MAQIRYKKFNLDPLSVKHKPVNMTGMPKTKRIFAIIEPITFPNANSGTPSIADCTAISSSGADVTKATTVKLTTNLEMDSLSANTMSI